MENLGGGPGKGKKKSARDAYKRASKQCNTIGKCKVDGKPNPSKGKRTPPPKEDKTLKPKFDTSKKRSADYDVSDEKKAEMVEAQKNERLPSPEMEKEKEEPKVQILGYKRGGKINKLEPSGMFRTTGKKDR